MSHEDDIRGMGLGPGDGLPHDFRTLTCACCGHQIKVAIDCKFRFCFVCAPRRSARVRRRLAWLIEHTPRVPGYRFKMITLSESNCTDVHQGVQSLVRSFRRLRQRAFWRKYVESGAFVIEITGRPNNWHPHIHAIVYARYVPWARLLKTWQSVSTGRAVHIQAIDTLKACSYITKYISKSNVPAAHLGALSEALRRFRLFQRFGGWHSLKVPRRLHDYACDSCGSSDWLAEWALHHGHYRPVKSLAEA